MRDHHLFTTERHTTSYVQAGPSDGPLLIFIHGWPELGMMWNKQLEYFSSRGFLTVAPDMRGYGRSSSYTRYADYRMEEVVRDMLELLEHLGRTSAIWVGHDWGAPVVWSIATHHPEACEAIANLCVAYQPGGFAPQNLIPLVNRDVYPEATYPTGQWDYQLYYAEHFAEARAAFEADVTRTFKAFIRAGNPAGAGKPSATATVRRAGGWFGGEGIAPDVPLDPKTLTEAELREYAQAFTATGFFGPNAWYMNPQANIAYAARAANGGRIDVPVLFFHAAYDWICDTLTSKLADPMRAACTNLTEVTLDTGHWMVQERPDDVSRHLDAWISSGFGRRER